MSWITWSTLAVFMLLFFLIQAFLWKRNAETKRLPPGPRGFPIFGCLHLLGKYPHKDLHKLAQKYGSIMFMRLGLISTIVVSSPQAAELFLKTHDLVFASKPPLQAFKLVLYNHKDMIMAPYGSYWRTMRKMCTLELLSSHKINSFKSMRKEELDLLIEYVKEAACAGVAVDLSAKVGSLSADMICRMVFGKKYMDKEFDERGFIAVIQEGMEYAATPNLADYIPQIASLDLQGLTKKFKRISKVYDDFLEKVIGERVKSSMDENRNKDFVDLLLSFMRSEEAECQIDIEHVKAIILDMLIAGMDTSAAAIEWALSELMKHPMVMEKVQKELEIVVGKSRMVEESDLDNLEYLDMVIKESMRLHPVGPLLIHESREDCITNDLYIPKKSRIFINVWAIGRDPSVWNDPEKFFPERFVGGDIDLRGRDFQLIPFGSGRRSCPGLQLGLIVVRLVLAQLMHCFNWELPNGSCPSELDMTEHFGLVTSKAKHLLAIPTYRLHK